MTRQELIETMNQCGYHVGPLSQVVDAILAKQAEEQADEVILGDGILEFDGVEKSWHMPLYRREGFKACGQMGQIFFRPTRRA